MLPRWLEPSVEKSCPSCGYKRNAKMDSDTHCPMCKAAYPKDKKQLPFASQVGIGAILIVSFVAWALWPESKNVRPEPPREEIIKRQFSSWDGSHREMEQYIKKHMNDPDSYQHVETRYWDNGDTLVVKTTFRGKNAFGGLVMNWVRAKVSLDGTIVEIIEQGP